MIQGKRRRLNLKLRCQRTCERHDISRDSDFYEHDGTLTETSFPIRLRTLTTALIFAHIYYTKLTEDDSRTGESGDDDHDQDMSSMLVFDHGGIEPDPAYQLQNDVLEFIYAQAARYRCYELLASLYWQA
jgi:hypothetical protein